MKDIKQTDMKNQILILTTTLASLGLMAFGFLTIDNTEKAIIKTSHCKADVAENQVAAEPDEKTYSDFFYDIGTRFSPIKKGDLDKINLASDFNSNDRSQSTVMYASVSVIIVIDDKRSEIRETGNSNALNDAQLNLLRSSAVSTNFVVKTEYEFKNNLTGKSEFSYNTPHLTIVPEKQAEYLLGKKALLSFLKNHNKENTANLDEDKLQPAKLYFTVSKDGSITDKHLDRTSGFKNIDKTMIDLMDQLPSTWIPAENAKGEKVDQELVVSFGMVGC